MRAYDEHLSAIMIQNDVLSAAAKEGEQKAKYAIASTAKKQGLSSEIIAGLTGLSIEEIEKL